MNSVVTKAEKVMAELGLRTPATRLVAGTVATGLVLNILKPSFAFQGQRARPFALLNNEDAIAEPTYFPWYLVSVLVGGTLATFL